MTRFSRLLRLDLPPRQSAFLWGARKTGKTTYLRERFPTSLWFDFLQTDTYLDFLKTPSLLRERISAIADIRKRQPVILDEVQKVPHILDEVHWLIENKGLSFVLCRSSARKMKRGHANLLGGRAWRYEMAPLTTREIGDFRLLTVLNHGLIPSHYLAGGADYRKSLKAYVSDYLKEEVYQEGLVRNAQAFSRFFDALARCQGELINFANVARDCGVDAKTVREYFHIMEDTLIGVMLPPFSKRKSRDLITQTPKFYLFDVGVGGYVAGRVVPEEKGEQFGRALEHFLFMEMRAYSRYSEKDFEIGYWRTKTGLEVDFVLGRGEAGVEVKGTSRAMPEDLKGLRVFAADYRPRKAILACNEKETRLVDGILIMPWRIFLDMLWNGEVV